MSRLEKLLKKWGGSSAAVKQQRICLDIGSSWTKSIVDGKFVMQPTCVLQHQPTSSVIAIGEKAEQLSVTSLKDTTAFYPVQDGKVVNTPILEQYLHLFLQPYIHQTLLSFFAAPKIQLAALYADRSAQAKACEQLLQHWSRKVRLQPISSALWRASQEQGFSSSVCIIDIGAMTTKFFIVVDGVLITRYISNTGGHTLTRDIQRTIRQKYHCEVGWNTAEMCKKRLARYHSEAVSTNQADTQLLIHGKDILTHLPAAICVDEKVCNLSLASCLERIIEGFQQLCQNTTPEFVADIQRTGIYLSGGGSQVRGLPRALEKKLHTKVIQSAHPQRDIVQGLWLA